MTVDRQDVERRKAGLRAERQARIELDDETAAQHAASWQGVLASEVPPSPPLVAEVLRYGAGAAFYRGKVNWLYGSSGTCKTWIAYSAVVERLQAGEAAVIVDYEMGEPSIVQRLRTLGASDDQLKRCLIVRPNVGVTDAAREQLTAAIERLDAPLGIFVTDSAAASLASSGLNFMQAADIEFWVASLPRWVCEILPTAAVVVIDHTSHEGSHATGSKRKEDTTDLALRVQAARGHPISVEQFGHVTVTLTKDRPGGRKLGVLFEFEGGGGHAWRPREPTLASARSDTTADRRTMIWDALDAMRAEGIEDRLSMDDLKAQLKGRPGASSTAISKAVAAMAAEGVLDYGEGRPRGIGIGPRFDDPTFAGPTP